MAEIDKTAKKMMALVEKNLKRNKWRFETKEFDDGECAIDTDISAQNEFFKGYDIRMLFRKWDMSTYYYLPIKAPEKVRAAVCEYLMRSNWRIRYGKFVMDLEDGEIRYEHVFSRHAVLADADDVLGDALNMMRGVVDQYVPGLTDIIFGGRSAAEAFKEALTPKKQEPDDDTPSEEPPAPPPVGAAVDAPDGGDGVASPSPTAPAAKGKKSRKRGKAAQKPPSETPASDYSLEGLNIRGQIPLDKIVAAVKRFRANDRAAVDAPRLNILLSGAPGSGKTAFARYLAKEVGAPLRTIRASQIVSKWVGDTEHNLAEAFEEAKENGEILLIDECDSFLQSREASDHSWEVTQTNELLQQMEEFDGVLIAATNFVDHLDKAVMRRFTYKVKLDYLTDDGKRIFFGRYFKAPLTEDESHRLSAIERLTPGDFRTVHEELYYLDDRQSNEARLAALEAESEAKGRGGSKIGF